MTKPKMFYCFKGYGGENIEIIQATGGHLFKMWGKENLSPIEYQMEWLKMLVMINGENATQQQLEDMHIDDTMKLLETLKKMTEMFNFDALKK